MWFAGNSKDSSSSKQYDTANRREDESRPNFQSQSPTSRRYLTDDEIVEVFSGGKREAFRLRIWRGKALPAIVLASQIVGGSSPSWSSSHLANLAFRAYLHFPDADMLNFEDETIVSERRLFFLEFRQFGHAHRCCLTEPIRRPFNWRCLEDIVGEAIARSPDNRPAPSGPLPDRRST
jgi:hypothetical protein